MKSIYTLIVFIFCGVLAHGQASSLYGKVTDEKTNEELLYANIEVYKNGVFTAGATTDFEGNYSIPVDSGTYELKISYTGFSDKAIKDVIIKGGQAIKLDIQMKQATGLICFLYSPSYKIPLIEIDNSTTGHTRTSEQIRRAPNKEIKLLLQNTPGVSISNF